MKRERLNVAVIGCGRVAQAHLKALKRIESAGLIRLEAIVSTKEDKAKRFAKEYVFRKYYTRIEDCLKDPRIDVVFLLLPNHLHASVAIRALNAGKHVMVEKPMCNTIKEADDIVRAVNKTGKKLMVAMCYRYESSYVKAKEQVAQGKIGIPIFLAECLITRIPEFHPDWWHKDIECGGFLWGLWGSHVIDRICWLTDSLVDSIYAEFAYNDPRFEGETEVAATIRLKNKCVSQIFCSWNSGFINLRQTTIVGTKNTLQVMNEAPTWGQQDLSEEWGKDHLFLGNKPLVYPKVDDIKRYELEDTELIMSILENREPSIPAKSGRHIVQVMEAARRSAKLREVQTL